MTPTIGISVSAERLHVVAAGASRIRWVGAADRLMNEPLAQLLCRLMSDAPVWRWPRPRVVVAIGPDAAQTKQLRGLPPLTARGALDSLVQEGATRFFLGSGGPLIASTVHRTDTGDVWATAFDRPLVEEVERACVTARMRLRAIVPASVVLDYAIPGDRVLWSYGSVGVEVLRENGQLHRVRRFWRVETAGLTKPALAQPLEELGDVGSDFAAAFGASQLRGEPVMAALTRPAGRAVGGAPRWRLALAASSLSACVAAGLLAPPLLDMRSEARARVILDRVSERNRAALATEAELRRVSAALDEVASFSASRRSALLFLAAITKKLPEGSAMVTLRTDSAGGSLVVLAPRAAGVLPLVERVPGVAAPQIVGLVTREITAARELERVMIRFQWSDAPAGGALGGVR